MRTTSGTLAGVAAAVVVFGLATGHETPHVVSYISVDVSRVSSVAELIASSRLIVVGTAGAPTIGAVSADGRFADYRQRIVVDATLAGPLVGAVELVRSGLAGATSGVRLLDDAPAGAVAVGRGVFFLEPSAQAGVYQIVGHTQGVLGLADGVTTVEGGHGLLGLAGLDEAGLRAVIALGRSHPGASSASATP